MLQTIATTNRAAAEHSERWPPLSNSSSSSEPLGDAPVPLFGFIVPEVVPLLVVPEVAPLLVELVSQADTLYVWLASVVIVAAVSCNDRLFSRRRRCILLNVVFKSLPKLGRRAIA